jgi:hypothetical protein
MLNIMLYCVMFCCVVPLSCCLTCILISLLCCVMFCCVVPLSCCLTCILMKSIIDFIMLCFIMLCCVMFCCVVPLSCCLTCILISLSYSLRRQLRELLSVPEAMVGMSLLFAFCIYLFVWFALQYCFFTYTRSHLRTPSFISVCVHGVHRSRRQSRRRCRRFNRHINMYSHTTLSLYSISIYLSFLSFFISVCVYGVHRPRRQSCRRFNRDGHDCTSGVKVPPRSARAGKFVGTNISWCVFVCCFFVLCSLLFLVVVVLTETGTTARCWNEHMTY